MPRATAASTIACVLGPRRVCSQACAAGQFRPECRTAGRELRRGKSAGPIPTPPGRATPPGIRRRLYRRLPRKFPASGRSPLRAGQRLQLEGDVLDDVPLPSAAAEPLEEAAADPFAAAMLDHRRQPGGQPVVEAEEHVGRGILQGPQVEPAFEHGKVGPKVRSAQNEYLPEFHGNAHGCLFT